MGPKFDGEPVTGRNRLADIRLRLGGANGTVRRGPQPAMLGLGGAGSGPTGSSLKIRTSRRKTETLIHCWVFRNPALASPASGVPRPPLVIGSWHGIFAFVRFF